MGSGYTPNCGMNFILVLYILPLLYSAEATESTSAGKGDYVSDYPSYNYDDNYKYNYPAAYDGAPGAADYYKNYGDYPAGDYDNGRNNPGDYMYDRGARNIINAPRHRPQPKSGATGGYQQETKTRYVPVVVKKKKKKQKIISISKGSFIPGGIQVFGKFRSLKACMKACGATPNCFAGDYDPWLGKCYFHSNTTACDNMKSHVKITHFKKIPCSVTDAPRGKILLGTQLFGSIEQKGIDDLTSCVKKCSTLGPGISADPTDLTGAIFGNEQLCFGVNYDFSSHKCYFVINNHPRIEMAPALAAYSICPIEDDVPVRTPIDLQPNPTVITILLCPPTD